MPPKCPSAAQGRTDEVLHLHVNTVHYRIQRIEHGTGRDLSRLYDRLDLRAALLCRTPSATSDPRARSSTSPAPAWIFTCATTSSTVSAVTMPVNALRTDVGGPPPTVPRSSPTARSRATAHRHAPQPCHRITGGCPGL